MAHRTSIACTAALLLAGPLAARGERGSAPPEELTLLALAVALSCSAEPAGAPAARQAAPVAAADAPPRTEIVATVRARSLRLDAVPDAEPLLAIAQRTAWTAERLNLPAHPEPGVVYRDVEVRLTVAGDPDDLAALLGEARRAARGLRIEPAPGEAAPP